MGGRSDATEAEVLQKLVSESLLPSIARLSGVSRALPPDRDYHFYRHFKEFGNPVKELARTSSSLLTEIAASPHLWGDRAPVSNYPDDPDDAYDWLVDIQDEIFERLDASLDDFWREKKSGDKERQEFEEGFRIVYGRKTKSGMEKSGPLVSVGELTAVKGPAERVRMPFHIASIPRPQDEFNIWVDNSNQPFRHALLEKSEDGSTYVHPLKKYNGVDFVDRNVQDIKPVLPLPLEETPFTLVEDLHALKDLAAALRHTNEFAVDLEHNHYRSFQGLTCLMQISTRSEDFVVDTLKLRDHIGLHLRDAFADPSKRKVMHGADRDVLWLQRDFSIYLCNLFDTQQASRVLQLERNSLEHLLSHFCEVTANKEYQTADWRFRPLPDAMIKYAREDTHYLLYIYDLMRLKLLSLSNDTENRLLEVYNRSYDVCLQLYEKELLTNASYLHIYGIHEAEFDPKQLAVVSGLCEWRDKVARAEDESTGYVLPNKVLLQIANQMPSTPSKLRRLLKSRHSIVEHNMGAVLHVIKSSMGNAAAFENVSEQLKRGRMEIVSRLNEETCTSKPEQMPSGECESLNLPVKEDEPSSGRCLAEVKRPSGLEELMPSLKVSNSAETHQVADGSKSETPAQQQSEPLDVRPLPKLKHGDIASVQVLKKPSRSFGALLGNPGSKRKMGADSKVNSAEQKAHHTKVEQIKSSVVLPFHKFSGEIQNDQIATPAGSIIELVETDLPIDQPVQLTSLEDIIPLENPPVLSRIDLATGGKDESQTSNPEDTETADVECSEDEATADVSVSDLSLSFQECFESVSLKRSPETDLIEKSPAASEEGLKFEPFDYAAARKQMRFLDNDVKQVHSLEGEEKDNNAAANGKKSKNPAGRGGRPREVEKREGPRRRQAFPASGNRSATFR